MELNIGQIINVHRSLSAANRKPLKFALARRLAQLRTETDKHVQAAEEQRLKLVKQYAGEPDSEGVTAVKPENVERFIAEYRAELQKTVELDFKPLSAEALESLELTIDEAAGLLPITQKSE